VTLAVEEYDHKKTAPLHGVIIVINLSKGISKCAPCSWPFNPVGGLTV